MNEQDLDRELQGYLDALVEEKMARGVPRAEAMRAARIELGGMAQVKEQVREARSGAWLDVLAQDLRYAARVLRRSPGFTAAAAITLALGIGANTALFTATRALLLRPLPYADAGRLVYVTEWWRGAPVRRVSAPNFVAWRAQAQTADRVEGYGGGGDFNLTGDGEPERVSGVMVTAGFLDLLGVRPASGRNFTGDEDRPGAAGAVLLSHGLWQRRFGGQTGIAGRIVRLDGRPYTIVGVLPGGFVFPDNEYRAELLVPMGLPPNPGPNSRLLKVMAHLRPGATAERMRAEFAAIAGRLSRSGNEVIVMPLREWLAGDVRRLLLVLQAAVALVLLIGCLNVANLQIARGIARRKEMAVRAALGAARGRLARQLLVESLLVAAVGGAAGLGLAYAGVGAVHRFLPANLHLLETLRPDGAVLAFTLGLAVLAGILTGVTPLFSGPVDLIECLKESGRTTAGNGGSRLRGALVIAEVALAMVLLSGSGLLIRSFARLSAVSPGFDPHGVLSLNLALPGGMLRAEGRYARPESRTAFFATVVERAGALPGVEGAAVTVGLPIVGGHMFAGVAIEGRPELAGEHSPVVAFAPVSPGYFRTMSIPIVAGRLFDGSAAKTAIVNRAFAAGFFPGGSALGHRVLFPDGEREIVGIAGDVRQQGLRAAESPTMYVPFGQFPMPAMTLLVRSETAPAALAAAVARAVREVDPDQPVFDTATMEQRLSGALSGDRANMLMMGSFAAIALLLAAVGIFGVIAYIVSWRAHEIGIRMALGADRGAVLRMVLGRGMLLSAAGIAIGLAGALAVTRTLRTLLFEVSATDPATLAGVAALFAAVSAAACYLPARRAVAVDPMVVLRHE